MAGILQPGYLPWTGFFEQMIASDVFVLLDDVQYDKHGWRNRNRVKSPSGPIWLSVPVLTKGRWGQLVNQVEIDPSNPRWPLKHVATLRQLYAHASCREHYLPELEKVLLSAHQRLLPLNLELIRLLASWLGIKNEVVLSSELSLSECNPTERLVSICRQLGADTFYEGESGRDYIEMARFEAAGIRVVFQDYLPRPYMQLHGPFQPYLSVVDLILNQGPDSRRFISGRQAPDFVWKRCRP